jgi:DNA-binding response OmpR family regulator
MAEFALQVNSPNGAALAGVLYWLGTLFNHRGSGGSAVAGEKILVVDDGQETREFVIEYVLKPHDYGWVEARDGIEALELMPKERPDLVLLDLQMPRLDGIGLLHQMRQQQLNVPVVLMTFHGSEEIAIEVFRLGVRDYVIKPFTDDELVTAIERALAETRLRQERDALTERLVAANRDLQRRVRELQALYGIGRSVASLLDADALLARITEASVYVTGAEEASVLLLDEHNRLIRRAHKAQDYPPQLADQAVDDPLARHALQTGKPVVGQAGVVGPGGQPYMRVFVPVRLGDRCIGLLGVLAPENAISGAQINLLNALADYSAIGIDRARLATALGEP